MHYSWRGSPTNCPMTKKRKNVTSTMSLSNLFVFTRWNPEIQYHGWHLPSKCYQIQLQRHYNSNSKGRSVYEVQLMLPRDPKANEHVPDAGLLVMNEVASALLRQGKPQIQVSGCVVKNWFRWTRQSCTQWLALTFGEVRKHRLERV